MSGSSHPGKKFKVEVDGKTVKFGAKGYSIAPGTKKGDNYCARSSGIANKDNPHKPNYHARGMWGCVGKESSKEEAQKYKEKYNPTRI